MKKSTLAVCLGIAAGVIDAVPMVPMGSSGFAIASAFAHWAVLGVLITYVEMDLRGWLKGLLIGLASAVPVALMVGPSEPTALGPIFVMSAVLGSLVGYLGGRFAPNSAKTGEG
ncbi:MAG: hypothetical protein QM765_33390 [Myxococcales bacterium]